MIKEIKLKKGLNIKLQGEAKKVLIENKYTPTLFAICTNDYVGLKPRLAIKEGSEIKSGEPLLYDKQHQNVKIVSPVSGTIKNIVRGDRRKLLSIQIEASTTEQYTHTTPLTLSDEANTIVSLLAEKGLLALITQMPYAIMANDDKLPQAIFISMFRDMPLSADVDFCLQGREDDWQKGIEVLTKIAPVFVCISDKQDRKKYQSQTGNYQLSIIKGKCPAGNVNVQINHIRPINKGDIIWTVEPEVAVFIGELYNKGYVTFRKRIAVCGSEIKKPAYTDVIIGQQISTVIGEIDKEKNVRIINGNVLTGQKTDEKGFIGAHTYEVTVIPEGDQETEMLGWIMPMFLRNRKPIDARIKGGKRHMIMSGEYDRVLPMDIYAEYLIKAIITKDIDRMEQLGIYEVAPEDFALAEYVDSSKLELQRIVREGLDMLKKENE